MIFASDYDGTLFKDVNKGIDAQDLAMIREFRRRGNLFGLVSGRPVAVLKQEVMRHNIEVDFLVGSNGGSAIDHNDVELFTNSIEKDSARLVYEFFQEYKPISYIIHDKSSAYQNTDGQSVWEDAPMEAVDVASILDRKVQSFLSYHGDEGRAQRLAALINESIEGVEAHQNGPFVDVGAVGIDKGVGMGLIADHFKRDRIFVIGDAQNDRAMVEKFVGFAMRDGNEDLKVVADYVVDSVAEAIKIVLEG
jgi:Cof subfamily protein (haloacid dehalogenase superfamily)